MCEFYIDDRKRLLTDGTKPITLESKMSLTSQKLSRL